MTGNGSWAEFSEWAGTLADLDAAAALLGWDRETHMPRGGAESRARALGTLAALRHREMTRPDVAETIAALAEADLDPPKAAAVRLASRDRRRALALPERLVRESSEASSRCISVWVEARPEGDFARLRPALERVVELKREEAEALREPDMGEAYDALLEGSSPVPGRPGSSPCSSASVQASALSSHPPPRPARRPCPRG